MFAAVFSYDGINCPELLDPISLHASDNVREKSSPRTHQQFRQFLSVFVSDSALQSARKEKINGWESSCMIDKGLEHKKKPEKDVSSIRCGEKERVENVIIMFAISNRVDGFFLGFLRFTRVRLIEETFLRTKKKPQITPGIVNLPFFRDCSIGDYEKGKEKVRTQNSLSDIMPENNRSLSLYHILYFFWTFCSDVGIQMKVSSKFTFFCPFNFILAFK